MAAPTINEPILSHSREWAGWGSEISHAEPPHPTAPPPLGRHVAGWKGQRRVSMTKDPWQGDKWTCQRDWRQPDSVRMSNRSQVLRTRLRVARAELDVSQAALARAVGVSRQTISSIETGQYCPSTVLALRLAHALAVPFTELFWLEGVSDASTVGT